MQVVSPTGKPTAETDGMEEPPPITDEEQAAETAKVRAQQGRSRRQGVAAESVSDEKVKEYKKPVYPKDVAQKQRLLSTLKEDDKMKVLFGHLDGEKLSDVINAFHVKDVPEGADIIKQGDEGDCLYIVETGTVDIFVARPGQSLAPGDSKGPKVCSFGSGALFGELAIMYNAPRAATVTAVTPVRVFVLDAVDFRFLLAQSSQAQYAMYEGWLKEVELLKTLNHFELSTLSEILESECFDEGEDIIKQGEPGDKFYILEDGSAAAYIFGDGGEKQVKSYSEKGDYFGEIALLTAEPRKATVRATGQGCNVVSLSKENFSNVLGPISDILKKHVDKYPQYADFLRAK